MKSVLIAEESSGIHPDVVAALKEKEDARFHKEHPQSVALHKNASAVMPNGVPMSWHVSLYDHAPMWVADAFGSRFKDVDGHTYSDFNIADMSMFCGYACEPIIRAVTTSMQRGNQFLLPTIEAITVSKELTRRYTLPKWQYTSSASQANVEAIRVARVVTGREKVLFFDGKYHGHFDEGLMGLEHNKLFAEERGVSASAMEKTVIVQWNDLEALEKVLKKGDIALVLTEPALTNTIGLLLPEPRFHEVLRRLTRENGTLLCMDETHTQVTGPGGLTKEWSLNPDIITLGKSIAGGIPLGVWGMTDEIADFMTQKKGVINENVRAIATGGTLFGNPLALRAAEAALYEVLTPQAYTHTQTLAEELAIGLRKTITERGFPWLIERLGPRINIVFAQNSPHNALEARKFQNEPLSKLIRVWLANRGVWDAIVGAGPTVSVPATLEDIAAYLSAFDALMIKLASLSR